MRMRGLAAVSNNEEDLRRAVLAGAALPLRKTFLFQSYFDSTLLEQAILTQNPGEFIVQSTIGDDGAQQVAGVGFALHPASQTPVAIQPQLSGSASSSATFILKPGQVFYPGPHFESFIWGLPNGWLGGGSAYLYVLKERVADSFWTGSPEVVFHRSRFKIYATNDNPSITTNYNWPNRFPWSGAVSGASSLSVPQGLLPILGIEPTKTIFRLRLATLAVAASLRMIWSGTEDFDLTSGGATYDALQTSASFISIDFPSYSASGIQIGGQTPAEFPIVTYDMNAIRIGGDQGLVVFVDGSGNIGNTTRLDVIRYGRIGG